MNEKLGLTHDSLVETQLSRVETMYRILWTYEYEIRIGRGNFLTSAHSRICCCSPFLDTVTSPSAQNQKSN